MNIRVSGTSKRQARRRGRQAMRALQVVTVGTFLVWGSWMCLGLFSDDPPVMPAIIWELAVLVAPAALAVYWRPAYRVPNCLWLTFCSATLLGMGGAGWGSWFAPVIAGATVLALLFAPRDGGRRAQWARRGPDAQRP
jgi:hypothetical protein